MTNEWVTTVPANSLAVSAIPDNFKSNKTNIIAIIEKEHTTLGNGNSGCKHKQGSARVFFQDAAPTVQVNNDSFTSGDLGLLWVDSNSSPDNQLNVLTATTPTWTPISTEIIAVLLASNRQFAGNLIVDGKLDVTGNIDPTTYETTNGGFLDEDAMGSNAADKVASQQSIKAFVSAYIKLVDSKSTATDGGTFTQDAWRKRTVTEETDIGSHCAVSSSVIVLGAGTYECRISCPAKQVDRHQIRLRNTTGGSTVLVGTSESSLATTGISNRSVIVGRFTIAASQNLEIQHYCETTKSTYGFGEASDTGEAEVYTIAEFWKR